MLRNLELNSVPFMYTLLFIGHCAFVIGYDRRSRVEANLPSPES